MRFEQEVNIFNPSALNRKFSAIQTDFDVTLGKISAIISDSDIEQYQDGHTTMNSRLSATIQDLDGFHDQVSEMKTDYDGQFESVDSRLTTFDETLEGITASVSTVSQEAIKSDQIHYLATSAGSGVTIETSGWTTTPQRITNTNKYLWTYHTYTKGDNSVVNTSPVITGTYGDQGLRGDTGVSITGVTNYYLASPLSSGVTTDTSGWTTGIQTMTATNQYLWNYEVVYGSDDVIISTSDPVIIGRYGQNGADGADGASGRGITSITEHYAVSSSNTTAPSRWSDTMVNTTTENRYLWNYETILYTDGNTEDSTKRVIGTHGEKGDSATTYEIRSSVDAIIRSQAGTPSPTFVTFTCYKRVGAGSATTQPCYWSIEEYVNGSWTTIEAGGSSASSKTRYVGTGATSVRATAYLESTMSSASLVDQQDVPIISNGADGYTVVLSNESHTFAGNVSSAVSGSTFSNVIAYKGSTRVAATIGTITGQPTGMTTSISYNGTTSARFNVDVSTSMNTKSGTLLIPVTVDGNTFALTFSYAVAFKGETGANGVNTATVYLYRLLTTTITPNAPVNQTTYTFSTKTLSGNPGGSWVTTPPSGTGTLWMAVATASSNTDTDTIEASEWTVAKLARDGSSGANGVDGYNKATITLYRRYASTPSKPAVQTVYTFATGTLDTIPSGWSLSIPAVDANHNPCYATSVSAVSRDDTYTIASSAWTTPVKIVEDGEDGIGIMATTPLRYVSSSTTAPAKPTANVKVTEDRAITGVWTKALPALTSTYKYIYTCDMIEWDDGTTITFTDVVLNNALSDLITRVAAAELKIQDDQIVATVRKSESYKSDLASKNANYTGDYVPTNSNSPASGWSDDDTKSSHVNDIFMTNDGKSYQYVQGRNGCWIKFNEKSELSSYVGNFVRIYYQIDGETYALPLIRRIELSGAIVFVPSNIFWVQLGAGSNSSNKWGFEIDSVGWGFGAIPKNAIMTTLPSITPTEVSGANYPKTEHPYASNVSLLWKYTSSNSADSATTYGWADRNTRIDGLEERMSSAELKITSDAIVSTVTSSEFGQVMTSAIKQTADGIHLDAKYVSWDADYSSMTKNGLLTCTGADISGVVTTIDTSSGRMTKVSGGRLEFYKHSTGSDVVTGYISPYYMNNSGGTRTEGITYDMTNNSGFLSFRTQSSSGTYTNQFVINNGLYPNYYADLIFFGRCMFRNSGRVSVNVTSSTNPVTSDVTFGTAFTTTPLVFLTVDRSSSGLSQSTGNVAVWVTNVTKDGFTINAKNFGSGSGAIYVNWIAFVRF